MNLYEAYKIIKRHHKTRRSLTELIDSRNSGGNRVAVEASLPYARGVSTQRILAYIPIPSSSLFRAKSTLPLRMAVAIRTNSKD